jgi:type II secretory pathway component PulJ
LVAIAIGAFIALAGTTYFATTFGAGISIQEATRAQAQFTALTNAVRIELRRAGYRGNPSQLANYLVTTEGSSGVAGDEGTFPAIDISTSGCALMSYAREHSCSGSDNANFAVCRDTDGSLLSGTDTVLHYRTGLRLQSGVVEAVSVIHPSQYDVVGATAPVSSDCAAAGGSSAWQSITTAPDLYVDRFVFTMPGETYFDADAGCEFSVGGCETSASTCGDTVSCRIERLYKVEVCAYPGDTDNQCASSPEGKLYAEIFVSPRNNVLISRDYD